MQQLKARQRRLKIHPEANILSLHLHTSSAPVCVTAKNVYLAADSAPQRNTVGELPPGYPMGEITLCTDLVHT